MRVLVKNSRIIDASQNLDKIGDIFIESGKIKNVGKNISPNADKIIEASGKIAIPGLVDMHVHLREPGREDKETIESGTLAAAKGGITSVLAMPNTEPAIDCIDSVERVKEIIKKNAKVNVFIAAAITKNRAGREVTEVKKLKNHGVLAVTDDGSSVDDTDIMHRALCAAAKEKILVICHCEDKKLSALGQVNKGFTSTRMGLRGISKESEYNRIKRDIDLAAKTGSRIHIAHVSCRESVEIIAKAKKRGIPVTAETAPHYFSFDESEIWGFDTNKKMNPPLRCADDVLSLKQALAEGVIDAVASDHAPHTENEKDVEFDKAAFGVTGLETELSACIKLVEEGLLDWLQLTRLIAYNPASILGINKGSLRPGSDADIVLVDADKKWRVTRDGFVSKSKNSCFIGKTLRGVVECTILNGQIIYKNESIPG
ncbi:MAG: dihydroorotase [Candidatus Omnitrophota bacterium]